MIGKANYPAQRWRMLRATVRDWYVLFREFRQPLSIFFAVTVIVALFFHEFYVHPENGDRLGYDEALYAVFTLTLIDYAFPIPDENHWLVLFYFLMPLIGLLLASQGIGGFLNLLFNRRARGPAWLEALVTTFNNHIVVCGLGHVGGRVAESLLKSGYDVVGIEQEESNKLAPRIRALGIPVIEGDVRLVEVLKRAGVERARSIIICTNNDMANIEAAFHCRDLNDKARLVVRMFDDNLAKRMKHVAGIDEIFSTSALAAPFFAGAALDLDVYRTFTVGDELLNVGRLAVDPQSSLAGQTIEYVEDTYDCSIILHKRNGVKDMHPSGELVLEAGDYMVILADFTTLNRLSDLTPSKH